MRYSGNGEVGDDGGDIGCNVGGGNDGRKAGVIHNVGQETRILYKMQIKITRQQYIYLPTLVTFSKI